MPQLTLLTWAIALAALVLGLIAGHFGWGKRWPKPFGKVHPDYLAGLDFLVSEQPDRALDMFLKLMDANAETLETHFALGALYRRRGEVERAIRVHQNLLARDALLPEHREQALLALAQDFLRAGLLDRAEGLFQQVSAVPRLRASALDALRMVYERQREWPQALAAYRQLERIDAAPPRVVAAHYLCEIVQQALADNDLATCRRVLREVRSQAAPFPRGALLRSRVAEREGEHALAVRLIRIALTESPLLLQEELPRLLALLGPPARDAVLSDLAEQAALRGFEPLKRLAFAALSCELGGAAPLRPVIERVFREDATLQSLWRGTEPARFEQLAREFGALLAHAEKYRCIECGFAGRTFYWHCPACHAWDTFEAYATVKLH